MLCITFIISMLSVQILSQNIPLSPCPRIFYYESDGLSWNGIIEIPSPEFGSILRLNLQMNIKKMLPTKYVGRIEILGKTGEIIRKLLQKGNLKYKVHFPVLDVIPTVTSIVFNGKKICTGPRATGSYVTTIGLQHVLNTNPRDREPYVDSDNKDSEDTSDDNEFAKPEYETSTNEVVTQVTREYSENKNHYNPWLNSHSDNNDKPKVTTESTVIHFKPSNPKDDNKFISDEKLPLLNKFSPSYSKPNPDTFAQKTRQKYNQVSSVKSQNSRIRLTYYEKQELRTVCGISRKRSNALVIKGEDTNKGDWPWLVAMFVKKVTGLDFTCGATLISKDLVVTAAHCIVQNNNRAIKKEEIIIKVGIFNLQDWTDEDAKTLKVNEIIFHPTFNAGLVLRSDIALLNIPSIEYDENILPACLWPNDLDVNSFYEKFGSIVGWGRDENGLLVTPEPRLTRQRIVTTEVCRSSRREFFELTSNTTMCAGSRDGTGPCNGDSGGGLFLHVNGRWTLRGIVSNSLPDYETVNLCNVNEYVIYTDVAKYVSWIESFL